MPVIVLKDIRDKFGPARNQGSRPTCIAFATSDVHAAARGQTEPLSVEHLYYHAVQRTPGGHPDSGVNLPTVLAALHHDGQTTESGWPYLDSLPADLAAWKPPSSAAPVYRRSSAIGMAATADVYAHLDAGRPVMLVLLVTEAFCSPDGEGIVAPPPIDPEVDYHAVIAVAHGQRASQRYVLVRNSWGDSWGVAGHAWVADAYLDLWLIGIATMREEEVV
jgi:hypothetical protein